MKSFEKVKIKYSHFCKVVWVVKLLPARIEKSFIKITIYSLTVIFPINGKTPKNQKDNLIFAIIYLLSHQKDLLRQETLVST